MIGEFIVTVIALATVVLILMFALSLSQDYFCVFTPKGMVGMGVFNCLDQAKRLCPGIDSTNATLVYGCLLEQNNTVLCHGLGC